MAATPDRRDTILESSAELFAKKGVASTTVRDIGESAGVFSGSLYHYFKSKNAIVAELLRVFMADIQERFNQVERSADGPEDVLRGLIRETLIVIELHPHPTAIYQNERTYLRDNDLLQSVDGPSREVREHWLKAIAEGVEQGIFRKDIAPEIFYRSVRDTLWSTNHWPDRQKYTTEEFADLMITLFLSGFRIPPKS
ncbi:MULTISPECIES: TetR/AcrR family transcriptional regulator [Rhodococcus]|uniref:TetR/AcrR family transcriptional regulator n=1 Tax=Rhodococcus globerulus TaxID=33008 RepID=A0ABU4C0W4_RHOGO|nr:MULTISPECIES: TetR/AcrR family transcriptional regulator [Rhodococcus]MDV6270122.1 TetR/AcrR family transcriptional regulator [Rhodococcus globerulus]MDV8065911.1 TetR/AcrR family transcriptional regulator [Rhodococcus sp. IEGM 1366]